MIIIHSNEVAPSLAHFRRTASNISNIYLSGIYGIIYFTVKQHCIKFNFAGQLLCGWTEYVSVAVDTADREYLVHMFAARLLINSLLELYCSELY
jgi:hypothetical protein